MADETEGPKVHTTPEEGHPAGTGERSDRDIGGPATGDDAGEGQEGTAHGTRPSGFDSHE
jgi:hypothetical protein